MKRTLGCCYYPEHWPQEMWADDAQRMVEAGLRWVRIGEFSWSRIEPAADQLDWQWLDTAVATLGAAGLQIIMGTPTATPPRWMLDKWPDMLAVDAHNQPRKFGSRRHYCFSHQPYRTECLRICRLMAERYGDNPHIQAWQTDNEYGCHETTVSYSASAEQQFRVWLARKYQNIAALNSAWGNMFWSMQYNSFEQIELANQTVTEANPSHLLDFRRFSSDQVVSFNKIQSDLLRTYSTAPLIHNYMGRVTDFDHYKVGADLDIASWDSYPLGFLEDRSEEGEAFKSHFSQQGDPDFQAFHHDLYRSVGRGRWWIMEQQPGPVNWAPYNPAPLVGMVRLWSWEAFAHGAEAVCYFRWRQAHFAQEQMHAGLYTPNNDPALGLAEVKAVAEEIQQMPDVGTAKAQVALVFDYESDWAWQVQPQGASFNYFKLVLDYYRALRTLGLSIDIIPADRATLNDYKLVVIPGLMHLSEALAKAIEQFSGAVIAGPRSGSKTADFAINLQPPMPWMHNTISHVESLRPSVSLATDSAGQVINWLETTSGEDPVLRKTRCNRAVLLGLEKRQYLTAWLNNEGLVEVFKTLCQQQQIAVQHLPEGLRIRETQQHRFVFNYNAQPVTYQNISIAAAGVHWEEFDQAKKTRPYNGEN